MAGSNHFRRRHQKNHAQDDALVCDVPGCGKTFYRIDLLHRHQERQYARPDVSCNTLLTFRSNETGQTSRQQSPEGPTQAPPVSVSDLESSNMAATTIPPAVSYYQAVSPIHESAPLPRYTYNPFRIPQMPRTPTVLSSGFSHVPRSSPISPFSPK
jgi:hypothetical protein